MPRITDIVAYTYRADMYCPECIVKVMHWSPMKDRADAEFALNDMAYIAGIDRENERTFDSDNFPKVVFRDQLGRDNDGSIYCCSNCGKELE